MENEALRPCAARKREPREARLASTGCAMRLEDRAHTGDLPSNNMKPRVRTSGDWFRQHVTGSEEAEIAGDRVANTGFTEEGAWSLEKDELGTGRPREKGMNTKVSEPEALSGRLGAEPELE